MNTQKVMPEEELPDFPFPLFRNSPHEFDYWLKNKLPLELFLKHDGHEVKIKRKKYVLEISDYAEHPRDTLMVEVTTWRGISPDAVHLYGHLILPSIRFVTPRTNISHSGHGIPYTLKSIELNTPLTEHERRRYKKIYENLRIGDPVSGFYSVKSIMARAKEVGDKYFPGFKIKTEASEDQFLEHKLMDWL